MVKNAEKFMSDLERQIKEGDEEEQTQSEEIVDAAQEELEEPQKEQEAEEEISEESEETPEEEIEEESEQTEGGKLRKRIEGNYKAIIKEKDEEIAAINQTLQEIQLQMAEQKGYQEAQKEPEIESDPEPDALLDPEEHLQWQLRQKDKKIENLEAITTRHAAAIQESDDRRSINFLEQDYRRRNPEVDYEACKDFIKDRERNILKMQFPTATDAEIEKHFDQYEVNLFKTLAARGQNATDIIVNMAKEYGYEPKANDNPTKQKPNFKALKKNQEKNASLIGGSDAVKEPGITPEQVLNMSIQQLAAGGEELFDKARKNLQ